MNKIALRSFTLGSLLFASVPAMATGFVVLPTTGFPVAGGASAYTLCNVTGDFGSSPDGSIPPTFTPAPGANNTCAIPSIPTGYAQTANIVRNIVMRNAYTRNANVTVGTVTDRVWRSGASCIYGAKIRLNNIDYDRRASSPGTQYFEINDILRAGFSTRSPAVAYQFSANSDDVLYRAGSTLTSIVHRPGDSPQPLTSLAPISLNWVDFTTDVNFRDDDGSSVRDSSWLLVRSTCTPAAPAALTGALKFRQMGQEGQPNIEVSVPGYAPVNANINP
ncbi:MAG: hypothetical protein HOP23_13500 [Methylococcaceae bacterium]|nr:hypothetical protein [Methylococcaceae bacterium]